MRQFVKKETPITLDIDWGTARAGRSIYIGKSAFVARDDFFLMEEVKDLKDVARYYGVILSVKVHYKNVNELDGFWFYCTGLLESHKGKRGNYDQKCFHALVSVFKQEEGKTILMREIIKDYGLDYSHPKIRYCLNYMVDQGYLTRNVVDGSTGHSGRPTTSYTPTEKLQGYDIPV